MPTLPAPASINSGSSGHITKSGRNIGLPVADRLRLEPEEADLPDVLMRITTTLLNYRYLVLAGAMLSATVLGYASAGQAQDGRIILAQQGDAKKKKEEPKKTPPKAPEVKKGPMK